MLEWPEPVVGRLVVDILASNFQVMELGHVE